MLVQACISCDACFDADGDAIRANLALHRAERQSSNAVATSLAFAAVATDGERANSGWTSGNHLRCTHTKARPALPRSWDVF